MDQKFPIIPVFKGALLAPFTKPLEILKSLLLFIGAAFLSGIAVAIFAGVSGEDYLVQMQQQLAARQLPEGSGGLLFVFFLSLMIVSLAAAHIFNYWVRFGAFGHDEAKFASFGEAFSASFVNMLKFIFIVIILGLVNLLVVFLMTTVGLGPDATVQSTGNIMQDMLNASVDQFATAAITTVLACLVYSLFSANLTQTALKSDAEGMEHPHTIDFAVVLMLLYALILIPSTLAAMIGSGTLYIIMQFVLGLYITLCIPVAHGIRYRICMANAEEEY
jgi:hypothetical protein